MEPLRRASSTTTLFRKQAAGVSDKYLFDYEVKYHDETEHFRVYYEISLTSAGANIAKAFLRSCESDYSKVAGYFGGITPPNLPFNFIIAHIPPRGEGTMPAYHYGCEGTDIYVDITNEANANLNLIRSLAISQIVEVFSAAVEKLSLGSLQLTCIQMKVLATQLLDIGLTQKIDKILSILTSLRMRTSQH